MLRTASVQPDSEIARTYGLYFLDGCRAVTTTFEHTFGLATGAAPVDAPVRLTRLGFDLSIGDDGGLDVAVDEPTIGRAGGTGCR